MLSPTFRLKYNFCDFSCVNIYSSWCGSLKSYDNLFVPPHLQLFIGLSSLSIKSWRVTRVNLPSLAPTSICLKSELQSCGWFYCTKMIFFSAFIGWGFGSDIINEPTTMVTLVLLSMVFITLMVDLADLISWQPAVLVGLVFEKIKDDSLLLVQVLAINDVSINSSVLRVYLQRLLLLEMQLLLLFYFKDIFARAFYFVQSFTCPWGFRSNSSWQLVRPYYMITQKHILWF